MRTIALIALAAFCSLHAADPAIAFPAEYACTMTMNQNGKAQTMKMIRGKGGLTRAEVSVEGQGEMVMILKPEQKQAFMLMPAMKMVMSLPINPDGGPIKDPTLDPKATWKKTGSEVVNKVACDIYEYAASSGKGTAWIDPARNVILRAKDAVSGESVDFSGYDISPQKASLFEVPADYKPMGPPGGMPVDK